MSTFIFRLTLPCLALLAAACSSSSSSTKDASGGNGSDSNGANDSATNGNATNGNATNGNGSRDSGPADAGTPVSDSGRDAGRDAGPPVCVANAAPAVGKLFLEEVAKVDNELVYAAQPPGSTDWYLVRRRGYIDVATSTGIKANFLDLSADISPQGAGGEEGLLGLTFHPDYASNGLFYVMLTSFTSVDQVREYKRSDVEYKAIATKTRDIVVLPPSASNHNGGTVMFGPDKLLYVGTGDGGGSCNTDSPSSNAEEDAPQDVKSLFGKMLRLDLTKPAPFAADGNPFAAESGSGPLVLHYGLRNPFRFGFDRVTGDLYIGDVGQGAYEEVDFSPKGAKGFNYGWADYEGTDKGTCSADREIRANSVHTAPVFSADRSPNTTPPFKDYISIIGGFVYRGAAIPKLQGMYFFGDYQGKKMGALYQCGATTSTVTPITKKCDIQLPNDACFEAKGAAPDLNELFAIVEGNDGEMYVVGNRTTLYKVVAQ